MTIRAVLFDLDNTLTHRDLSVQAYSRYLADYYTHSLQQVEIEKITEIVRRIDNGGYPKKELLTHSTIGGSVAHALREELAWRAQPSLEELTDFWFQNFGQFAVAMPQAEQLLQSLKSADYKLAVISNGGHETRLNIINGLGFSHYFDEIISSGLVGISKPNPEIFLHTAEKLEVAPEHCLYIGDHPINDIQGAENAGMQSLWIEGFHAPVQPIERKIKNLVEVLDYLKA
ncbi:HAD family hydrolase [Acinetobacter sp. HR7]|uniref:HAD family hydrolase n=1 Tax=Acinetobacter sp. HR7 TaxID=1509403 RepID=UPI000538A459|nr:HAD family hydrolase [Acinetobacter sp. HR7]KGT47607.1 haloacid dehalogenase, type II [Acinetobacter sp. HR7]